MARLDSVLGSPGMKTPEKISKTSTPRMAGFCGMSENSDPNLPGCSPSQRPISSPAVRSAKAKKSAPRTPCRVASPSPAVQERKFIVAKRNTEKGEKERDLKRCQRAAYEALRASQEDFFRRDQEAAGAGKPEARPVEAGELKEEEEEQKARVLEDKGIPRCDCDRFVASDDSGVQDLEGSSKVRKMRSLMMEEAMNSMLAPGSGRVMHLVKAFERLLSISKEGESDKVDDSKKKVTAWALPGLRPPPKVVGAGTSSSSVTSSMEFCFPPRDFERDSVVYCSFDSNNGRLSLGGMASEGGRRSRRNIADSLRSSWNKKLKVTSQHPFKLRTEERGKLKQEYFLKKVREMLMEEDKKRIPIAQGLPWTTDEPECLVKPPVKETTEPVDLVLHSDVRAAGRLIFDHYVDERMMLAEQIKMEREKQRKLEEEEEIRKLRKELVPKAQPMPYFDRPFIPKKSTKPHTIPREPRFHVRRPHRAWSLSYHQCNTETTNEISLLQGFLQR